MPEKTCMEFMPRSSTFWTGSKTQWPLAETGPDQNFSQVLKKVYCNKRNKQQIYFVSLTFLAQSVYKIIAENLKKKEYGINSKNCFNSLLYKLWSLPVGTFKINYHCCLNLLKF